jgi:hypothetical protein
MMTATPEGVRWVKEEIVYVDTDVLHCKLLNKILNNYSSNLIKTIQLDQESSGHQYKQSLNSSVEIKRSDCCRAMMETTSGLPNKTSKYKSKYKEVKN